MKLIKLIGNTSYYYNNPIFRDINNKNFYLSNCMKGDIEITLYSKLLCSIFISSKINL